MRILVILALSCLWVGSLANLLSKVQNHDLDKLWEKFKITHNKKYDESEEFFRRKIWEDNVNFIQRHNLEYDMGMHTYTVGINQYADLTPREYQKYLLGARPDMNVGKPAEVFYGTPQMTYPDTVDWRTKNVVTPIKNQGQCGSCWAFSSTGALEGQKAIKYGKLVSLSEQNLVDCVKTNYGCSGGWMSNAFQYVISNHGIDLEADYPYEAKDDTCRYRPDERGAEAVKYVNVSKSEDDLKAAVATVGPISVAIDATHQSFMLYKTGVYQEPECSSINVDHAVLAVGYGTYQGLDYWLVKNSWGTSWGLDGYIMMRRNYNNMCAIATYASYPIE